MGSSNLKQFFAATESESLPQVCEDPAILNFNFSPQHSFGASIAESANGKLNLTASSKQEEIKLKSSGKCPISKSHN
jgi:hypothetical protein